MEGSMRYEKGELIRIIKSFSFVLFVNYCVSACTDPQSVAYDTYDPLDCLNDIAEVDPSINVGLATKLCSAAWTPEPVKCYSLVSKEDSSIPRFIAIDLCAGTVNSKKTIECYVKAGTTRQLNRGLATTLCGARKTEDMR